MSTLTIAISTNNLTATTALRLHPGLISTTYLKFTYRFGLPTVSTPSVISRAVNGVYFKAKHVMVFGMITSTNHFKILWSIIQLIAIFVVHKLTMGKLITGKFFNYKSMSSNLSTLNMENMVTVGGNPSTTWSKTYARISMPFKSGVMHLAKTTAHGRFATIRHRTWSHRLYDSISIVAMSTHYKHHRS